MSIKKLFEQFIDQVDINNTITEEKKSDLIQLFEEKISEVKEQAFNEALETIDEDHTEKLQQVISIVEEMDEDHAEKLQQIVESIDEDHTNKLQQIIEAIDEDHTNKLQQVVDSIDESHSEKLQQVLEKIDEDHTNKLQQIIELYENQQGESLTEDISNYLDAYLEEVKPADILVNEARLNKLESAFDKMREILLVNEEYVDEEVKEAVLDAHKIIEEKDKEINKLMLEKVETKQQIKLVEEKADAKIANIERQIFLEEKTKGCTPKMRAYLELCFEDASKDEIEEKFDEAVEAFKQTEKERRELIIEQHRDRIDDRVIPEATSTEEIFEDNTIENKQMNIYANIVNKVNKRNK